MPDLKAVHEICGRLDRGDIHSLEFVQRLARAMAEIVGCSRAAVRLLVVGADATTLRTLALYDTAAGTTQKAPDMVAADGAAYVEALLRDGTVVAPDVSRSPAAAPFLESYLRPQGVRSLLDIGFTVNGVLYGTFSCEQLGAPVAWTQAQINLMRQISARATITVMHAINADIDTTPGALWEPSTPNRLMTMPVPLDDSDADPGRR